MFFSRYEWTDIGMLDYDPSTKLYLVKRVRISTDLQECEQEALSRQSQRSRAEEDTIKPHSGSSVFVAPKSSGSNLSPKAGSQSSSRAVSMSQVLDPIPVYDYGDKIQQVPKPSAKSSPRKSTGFLSLSSVRMKEGGLESEGGAYHWVPRVRVMFAAEDPRVFASRVAHAHMSRSAQNIDYCRYIVTAVDLMVCVQSCVRVFTVFLIRVRPLWEVELEQVSSV